MQISISAGWHAAWHAAMDAKFFSDVHPTDLVVKAMGRRGRGAIRGELVEEADPGLHAGRATRATWRRWRGA